MVDAGRFSGRPVLSFECLPDPPAALAGAQAGYSVHGAALAYACGKRLRCERPRASRTRPCKRSVRTIGLATCASFAIFWSGRWCLREGASSMWTHLPVELQRRECPCTAAGGFHDRGGDLQAEHVDRGTSSVVVEQEVSCGATGADPEGVQVTTWRSTIWMRTSEGLLVNRPVCDLDFHAW